jgi:hypothetical protein
MEAAAKPTKFGYVSKDLRRLASRGIAVGEPALVEVWLATLVGVREMYRLRSLRLE